MNGIQGVLKRHLFIIALALPLALQSGPARACNTPIPDPRDCGCTDCEDPATGFLPNIGGGSGTPGTPGKPGGGTGGPSIPPGEIPPAPEEPPSEVGIFNSGCSGGGCGGGCGGNGFGTPALRMCALDVIVCDTPIGLNSPTGPSPIFSMRYDSLDSRSRSAETWPSGYRWHHVYNCYVESVGTERRLRVGGNRYFSFVPNGQGGYKEQITPELSDMGGRLSLRTDGSNLIVRARFGGYYAFEPAGASRYRMTAVGGVRGGTLSLNYASDNTLTSIVSSAGNSLLLNYSSPGYLTNVMETAGGRSARFVYTNDLLAEVTDMGGQTFKYGYDSEGRLTSLKRPRGSSWDTTSIAYSGSPSAAYRVTISNGPCG